jgi:superfamily II DNA or RNA helicase
MSIKKSPGELVTFRGRDWIVLPSPEPDVQLLKPIGGSNDEVTGVYLPLQIPDDAIHKAEFAPPQLQDLGDFQTAKMLFDATRLSFRHASGPFRCFGKLSFRPRSYQVVPLIKALEQDVLRLLIADDVGIGKTVEALMILKEKMERGDIKKFAVICLPHLCEQWQGEIRDKLDIEAEIIRSSTAAALDRRLPDDRSVFYHLPYQVISIDYLKSDKRRPIFLNDIPDLIIVDEAHTCAKPAGAKSPTQQQRYHLLHEIAKKENQHLLLLTATPHSGKDEEFQSLLGLLNKEFESYDLEHIDQNKRRKIARHFIQRKRENIKRWLRKSGEEKTPFPERDTAELKYSLSEDYRRFYNAMVDFAGGISHEGKNIKSPTFRYWAALALLRGVMSSPAAGAEMLRVKELKKLPAEEKPELDATNLDANRLLENTPQASDSTETEFLDQVDFSASEVDDIQKLLTRITELGNIEKDIKAAEALRTAQKWVKEGYNPIIFCKYIATAEYLGKLLKEHIKGKVEIKVITSTLPDEQRREEIEKLQEHEKRILVATDCLSEGINLQGFFNAVIHYDLPWNPNRIEQREGRVDRFGQESEKVRTLLLYCEENPIDRNVLKILIRKVRDIQKATGVSITLGEENTSIMAAVIREVFYRQEGQAADSQQMTLFAEEFYTRELETVRKKAENLRSIFAHESIDPAFINDNLDEIDEAIGDVKSLEHFVTQAIVHLGGNIEQDIHGYLVNLQNLPPHLQSDFPQGKAFRISFESPTPKGYRYIGRNHRFTEQLCQFILSLAMEERKAFRKVARTSVIQTKSVEKKTTLIQFRVRNVIREQSSKNEVIGEEMYLWGYRGSEDDAEILDYEEAKRLLFEARSEKQLSLEMQESIYSKEEEIFSAKKEAFLDVARERAQHLSDAHDRFRKGSGGKRFEAVYPVLPPDLMGVYILTPTPKDLF